MVREFQAVLDGLPCKSPVPLEEYRELICEMRRRGLTYREIAAVLADRFQVNADLGVIHDVLRGSVKRRKPLAPRRVRTEAAAAAPQVRPAPQPAPPAVRMIPAVRPPVRKEVEGPVFEYDENQPLRLIGNSKSTE